MTMRRSATALLVLVCSLLVAACGDSGSGSTTGTVPTGRVGAASTSCTPPRVSGLTVLGVTAVGISCDTANAGTLEVIKTNRYTGYTCKQTISGRNVRVNCVSNADAAQSFSASWAVS